VGLLTTKNPARVQRQTNFRMIVGALWY